MRRHEQTGLAVVLGLLLFAVGRKGMGSSTAIDHGSAPALPLAQLRDVAARAGFTGHALDVAVAVAMAETRGYPQAVGDKNAGGSYGLWQINIPAHPEFHANPSTLFDPDVAAAAAYRISKAGTDFSPWSTFTGKQYLAFMPAPSSPPPITSFVPVASPVTLQTGQRYAAKVHLTGFESTFGSASAVKSKLQAAGFSSVIVQSTPPASLPGEAPFADGSTYWASGVWSKPPITKSLPSQVKAVWSART